MLKIFNDLSVFFDDVYIEVGVREYARMNDVSPPTASSLLEDYAKEGILIGRKERNLHLFRANLESYLFRDLALLYWRYRLKELLIKIHDKFMFNRIILFGSVAKGENKIDSDIDLYVDMPMRDINLEDIERKIKRKIQIHFKDAVKNKNLRLNIERGVRIL